MTEQDRLAEIKDYCEELARSGAPDKYLDWLIAEVERQTAENHRLAGGAPRLAEKERLNREIARHVAETERLRGEVDTRGEWLVGHLRSSVQRDAEVERLRAEVADMNTTLEEQQAIIEEANKP